MMYSLWWYSNHEIESWCFQEYESWFVVVYMLWEGQKDMAKISRLYQDDANSSQEHPPTFGLTMEVQAYPLDLLSMLPYEPVRPDDSQSKWGLECNMTCRHRLVRVIWQSKLHKASIDRSNMCELLPWLGPGAIAPHVRKSCRFPSLVVFLIHSTIQ